MEIVLEDTKPLKQEQMDSDDETKTEILGLVDSGQETDNYDISEGAVRSDISPRTSTRRKVIMVKKFVMKSAETLRANHKNAVVAYALSANQEIRNNKTNMKELQKQHKEEIKRAIDIHKSQIQDMKDTHQSQIQDMKDTHQSHIQDIKDIHMSTIEEIKAGCKSKEEEIKVGYDRQLTQYKNEVERLTKQLLTSHDIKTFLESRREIKPKLVARRHL